MAKPTKNAALICVVVTVVAAAGIGIGIWQHSPLIAVIGMLPAVGYEVYRTEGSSTKLSSIIMLVVLVALIALIVFKVSFNIAPLLKEIGIGGSLDAKLAGPVIIAILALLLLRRTEGIFTKWLALVIILSAAGLFFILDSALLSLLLKTIGVGR
jgi:hypothetical protein